MSFIAREQLNYTPKTAFVTCVRRRSCISLPAAVEATAGRTLLPKGETNMKIDRIRRSFLRIVLDCLKPHARVVVNLLVVALLLAFSPSAQAQQTESAARLAPLTDQLRLGRGVLPESHRYRGNRPPSFRLMHQYGLTVARIFIIWDDIERTPINGTFTVMTGSTTLRRNPASRLPPRFARRILRAG